MRITNILKLTHTLSLVDRLYLASYTNPPDATTPFPYPRQSSRSPSKRSSKAHPAATGPKAHPPVYFTIDKTLLYNAFHGDFGPLHIGHLYRYAVQLHEVLGDPANEERGVVFWSNADSRSMFILLVNIEGAYTDHHQAERTLRVFWHAIWSSSSHGHHILPWRRLHKWTHHACPLEMQATVRLITC
jgi:hypothetical protein